jgi:hypothetical protein
VSEQNFTAWFVDYPSTHVKAGETVEVVPRALYEQVKRDLAQEMSLTRTRSEMLEEFGADYERWLS